MARKKVVIMGAGGRDFHNFNVFFRENEQYEVVAFTATQIPDIAGRSYPPELAGRLYPDGIEIVDEKDLPEVVAKRGVGEVIFSYSDVAHKTVMNKACWAMSLGCDFRLLGGRSTQIESRVPVIGIVAVRTGCGKSPTTRRVCRLLAERGIKYVVIRHPMPYGDLRKQGVQRFEKYEDLDRHKCTIEEREEYEPHLKMGTVVFAGADYGAILREAEKEAQVILWDGGNNDMSFYKPDLLITVTDPHRPGDEVSYFPGEVNLRQADVVIINKEETASFEDIEEVRENIMTLNPKARIIDAASPIFVDKPGEITGRKVLVIEDGPTVTHGEMGYGAGYLAAERNRAGEILDPRPYLVGDLVGVFEKYPHVGELLPAMGYGEKQIRDLKATIDNCPAEVVVVATPIDLRRIVPIEKPTVRVWYETEDFGQEKLETVIDEFCRRIGGKS